MSREEYHLDVARGHRSPDARPIVKIGGVGKFSTADALDYEAGEPYVRKEHLAPYAHLTAPGPFPGILDFQENELREPHWANCIATAVPEGHASGDIAFVQQSDAST